MRRVTASSLLVRWESSRESTKPRPAPAPSATKGVTHQLTGKPAVATSSGKTTTAAATTSEPAKNL